MKSLFVAAFALFTVSAFSQLTTNALGLRFGDNDGLGTEISYQRLLGENNRLELDLGWRNSDNHDAMKLTGIYQWVNPLGSSNFYWYVGVGGGLGIFDYDKRDNNGDGGIFITLDGMIGIEYSFINDGVPIQLALDFNPEFGVVNSNDDDLDLDIAFSIRYQW